MNWLDDALNDLEERHLLREPVLTEPLSPTRARVDGQDALVFCGNDYLGLRLHPDLAIAARQAIDRHGTGAGASRLVSGNLREHEALERTVAEWLGTEAALVGTSGFAVNIASLEALCGRDDVIFSDALNHASIIDASRLSRARVVVYPHGDADALAALVADARPFRRGWIATESLFSMDGDVAPLDRLHALALRESLHLYVDEAHALGVLGPEGRGACAAHGFQPDVLAGTFGKSFGSAGAFLAGTTSLRRYLWSRHRGHVFSTGSPPGVAASAEAAVRIATEHPAHRQRLHANVGALRQLLRPLGVGAQVHPESPILPLVLGDPRRATEITERLLERGFFVQAIRPPTVPEGTARLRITVSAAHTLDEIDAFANALLAVAGPLHVSR